MSTISSRERMITAIRYQHPDRVPLHFKNFGFTPPAKWQWTNDIEEAERWLALGTDPWLWSLLPHCFHPDVRVRQWEERPADAERPVLVAEYDTPAGVLRQEVYRTDDWESPTGRCITTATRAWRCSTITTCRAIAAVPSRRRRTWRS